ncbi:MAG: Cold-active serine alkaline protease [Candidatus Ozemobacter sibiricus]|jgi:hypothetical protein|uniref:Cold-active serine alkaline protease n=1 Tax=Candidatus Ozemobacter sibiricus TaxID=2268124 RepID=A0A367ZUK0_9BACT|nr:MAG: Cold-active serine alkaline protease [Candidatus Ozemobacter sibiricus]
MRRASSCLLVVLLLSLTGPGAWADDWSASGEITPPPWSGDWWSRKKGFLVLGWPGHSPSPFEKYDAYVESRTGRNPGAHAWEKDVRNTHYNPKAEDWEGHCNGWAAASILVPEPRQAKVRNGITFLTADQKGILSEQYMNTYCMFYGRRNWGNPGDDPDDIYPDEFHKLLLEYIGNKKSAIICDTSYDRQVWNFPLFKFESSWSTGWFDKSKLKVRTTVYYVDDGVRPDYIGTKWFSTTYTYNLFLDSQGNITGGEWTGSSRTNHPDFVWVPTADAPNPPGTVQENPRIDPRYVKEIVEGPEVLDYRQGDNAFSGPDAVVMEAGLNPAEHF